MQCALAIRPGDLTLDEDGEPDKDLLISVCAGIVVTEKSAETITLVHYTAQEEQSRPATVSVATRSCANMYHTSSIRRI